MITFLWVQVSVYKEKPRSSSILISNLLYHNLAWQLKKLLYIYSDR